MTARGIPAEILRMYPSVPDVAWERLSEHRYRAPHPSGSAWTLVVHAFGTAAGRGVGVGPDELTAWPDLIEHVARSAAYRLACGEGTPILRPNTPANRGVVGCCQWCGLLPVQHGVVGAVAPLYSDAEYESAQDRADQD